MTEQTTQERLAELEARVAVLESERERLRKEIHEHEWLLGRQSFLLTGVANALKGDPGPQRLHDWSDLPLVARGMARRLRRFTEGVGAVIEGPHGRGDVDGSGGG